MPCISEFLFICEYVDDAVTGCVSITSPLFSTFTFKDSDLLAAEIDVEPGDGFNADVDGLAREDDDDDDEEEDEAEEEEVDEDVDPILSTI